MSKKKALFFAVADINNFTYGVGFWNSMTKFHSPNDISMVFYTNENRPEQIEKLPKGIVIKDLSPYIKDDPMFFYRQKPVIAEGYLDEYDLVVGFDVDQIVLGKLDYLLSTSDFDVATVLNTNRADPQVYGYVELGQIGIHPMDYFNCGLVALRSKKFAHDWKVACYTPQFDRLRYKEQDILNIMCYYGNWNVRCLDHGDGVAKMSSWWGLISKGEWNRAQLDTNGDIFIPRGLGDTPFPPQDMTLKVVHVGGGSGTNKMNYHTWFPEEVVKRVDELVKPTI